MNVTIKINDQLGKEAKHRAVDEGLSLSGWVAEIIRRELSHSQPVRQRTLLEAIGCEELSEFEVEFPRIKGRVREVDFS